MSDETDARSLSLSGLTAASDYVELVARIHEVYRHLVMDTPEDRAIHARHVEVADSALALARARFNRLRAALGDPQ